MSTINDEKLILKLCSLEILPSKKDLEHLREHRQKTFVTLSGFWRLKGWGSLSESVKKGKFVTKICFSDMLNEVLKIREK